jgi:subtilase family serine protease
VFPAVAANRTEVLVNVSVAPAAEILLMLTVSVPPSAVAVRTGAAENAGENVTVAVDPTGMTRPKRT